MLQLQLEQGQRAPRHPQQLLEDVRPIVPEPGVHVLVGDVLPDPLDVSGRRLQTGQNLSACLLCLSPLSLSIPYMHGRDGEYRVCSMTSCSVQRA